MIKGLLVFAAVFALLMAALIFSKSRPGAAKTSHIALPSGAFATAAPNPAHMPIET